MFDSFRTKVTKKTELYASRGSFFGYAANKNYLCTKINQAEMKTLAFVHRSPFPNGGAEKVTIDLAQWFVKQGWRIYIIAKSIDDRLPAWIKNSNSVTILTYNKLSHKQLARFVVEMSHLYNFDAIVVQGLWLRRIDIVHSKQSAPIIHCNHGVPLWQCIKKLHALGSLRQRTAKWPILGRAIGWLSYRLGDYFRRSTINTYKMVYDNCDVMTQLCDAYTETMANVLNLPSDNHLMTMHNAQPPAPINYSTDKRREVLYMGRLSHSDKRVDRLLDIWHRVERRHPEWCLKIVGEGRERPALEAQAARLGLQRVEFCGATATPYIYYNTASILCLTSTFEGMPLVLGEAQQAGVVPIAFACVDGIIEILSPSWENGVLIEPFDLDAFAAALSRLMSDDDLRHQMAANCREKVNNYSIEHVGRAWEQLLEQLASDKPTRDMDTRTITIRAAVADDAELIATAVCMAVGYDRSHPIYPVFRELAEREVAQYSYRNALIAEVDGVAAGAIVGYDGARLEELREPIFPLLEKYLGEALQIEDECEAGEFYLDSLGVLPQFQGLGVGARLLTAMRDRAFADGHQRVGLIVDFDNPRAERLYTSLGWHRVGEKRFLGHRMWHLQCER